MKIKHLFYTILFMIILYFDIDTIININYIFTNDAKGLQVLQGLLFMVSCAAIITFLMCVLVDNKNNIEQFFNKRIL